jgi:hypothetical protein
MPNALLAKTFPDPHEKLRRDMYVYSRQDLEELLRYLTELHRAIMFFHFRHQPRERIVTITRIFNQSHLVHISAKSGGSRILIQSRALKESGQNTILILWSQRSIEWREIQN